MIALSLSLLSFVQMASEFQPKHIVPWKISPQTLKCLVKLIFPSFSFSWPTAWHPFGSLWIFFLALDTKARTFFLDWLWHLLTEMIAMRIMAVSVLMALGPWLFPGFGIHSYPSTYDAKSNLGYLPHLLRSRPGSPVLRRIAMCLLEEKSHRSQFHG